MRKRFTPFHPLGAVLPIGVLVIGAAAAPPKAKPASNTPTFEKNVAPLIKKYCVSCHSGDKGAAGISLHEYTTGAQALKARGLWDRVVTAVASKHMPPKGMPEPTPAEREAIVGYLQTALSKADCDLKEPGRVTLRRLNRAEYNNTIRDLVGVDIKPADAFPNDDVGYGFDNIGDVLSVSPLLLEKYLAAARKVARAAIHAPEDGQPTKVRFNATRFTGDGAPDAQGVMLYSNGQTGVEADFNGTGMFLVRVRAFEQHAGKENAKMAFYLDGKEFGQATVSARIKKPGVYEAGVRVEQPGRKRVTVGFLNDYYDDKSTDPQLKGDRNLIIQELEIEPHNVVPAPVKPSLAQKRILFTRPTNDTETARDAATREIMARFARRAYRRPVTTEEVGKLVRVAAAARKLGGSFEQGVRTAVTAALVSPNFLFMVEKEPATGGKKRLLNDFELATRLSYFLWSSMPDEPLMILAAQGKLRNPDVLIAQAKRMLNDPKASALAENFAGQWLQLRKLSVVAPDPQKYPTFSEAVRKAMRTETEMYFTGIVREDRSILEFLDSNYTYLNGPLAGFYGYSDVQGQEFRRVALKTGQRGGILTQASILTVTSNPNRTSPVKRGKWVMENILGSPIPAAPPNVPQLADDKKGPLTGTLRQRMEQHRDNPACASCHQRMDPIGFGLENYDAVGAWRTMDGTDKIDASGTLPDGASFDGSAGLRKYLMSKKEMFARTFVERLLTYALGRGIEVHDRCNIDAMAQQVGKRGYRFSEVVATIVTSEPFRYKSVEKPEPKKANVKVAVK
ncbi:MAG: DUF1592 domain-containing protein [Capsulimonadales bacterium]|nr:DUF1592 domain-containing protein [Capsulimonadales bacterium]